MKRFHMFTTSSLALLFCTGFFVSCPSSLSADESNENHEKNIPVQFLGINDFHGSLDVTGTFIDDSENRISNAGGAALLSTYLNQAQHSFEEKHPNSHTFRVQAGDMVGASPANSGLLQDEPTIHILNKMKFTVGTLGNHEFDEGLSEYLRILNGDPLLPHQLSNETLQELVDNYPKQKSMMDIVVSNMVEKKTGNVPKGFHPYVIKEVENKKGDPVKVGFIGLVTTEIPNLVLKDHYEQYDFLDEATSIVRYAKELRDQGVNAIVVLSHTAATSDGRGNVTPNVESERILRKVNELDPKNSVDLFFAGHNHQYTNGTVKIGNQEIRVVQSTSQGKGYIDVQGVLDTDTKDFVNVPEAKVSPVVPTDLLTPDKDVQAIIDDANQRVAPIQDSKIGEVLEKQTMTRSVNEHRESPVGNLIVDGQLAQAKKQNIDADFAMTNNGGIRSDLIVTNEGIITWGAAQAVQPFGNVMQVVEMTGQQIETVLNQQSNKYFLQIAGMSYTYEPTENEQYPEKIVQMFKTDGTPIQKDHVYRVIINDFLLGGGDGFKEFTKAKLVDAMSPDTETFISYIESFNSPIPTPKLNRKTLAVTEKNGWVEENNQWSYYENNEKVTHWKKIAGVWYFFNENGIMHTGWLKQGNTWYFFNKNGNMMSNWQKIAGVWYFFNENGSMHTDWLKLGNTWYFFNKNGNMMSNWQKIAGVWYFFNENGSMHTGWLKLGNTWYFFNNNGNMMSNWQKIAGVWYFFNENGSMQTGRKTIKGKTYHFTKTGAFR